MSSSAVMCNHANEMPTLSPCPCPPDCYCKTHSCRSHGLLKPFPEVAFPKDITYPDTLDSGDRFLALLPVIAQEDVEGLTEAAKSYGDSWKCRGGVGAFMMAARKWDRLERRVRQKAWDIFAAIFEDQRREGVIDDVRDLRRYLMLFEAEVRARGFDRVHRDNERR